MGNCVATDSMPENQFRVKNINDDKRLVQKGLMEVTATDLMYTDSKTEELWQWPLKYLRKYGCDGDVFSFEAGRKCPGGEGLYAFSTPKASQLFDLVARNITQDSLHPPENLSPPYSAQETDNGMLRFPHSAQPASIEQPYRNMGPNGTVLLNVQTELSGGMTTDTSRESSVPKLESPPPVTPPGRVMYREVVFQKPPEDHPPPTQEATHRTPYSKIDFDETQKRLEQLNGSLQVSLPHNHSRISTSSAPGDRRLRMHTFTASTSKHSISSGSLSSQTSQTESVRETRPHRANGSMANYQNIPVGCGDPHHLTSPPYQHPSYENLTSGTRSPINPSCPPTRSTSTSSTHHHPTSLSSSCIHSPNDVSRVPLPEVFGPPMAHYAELDLSGSHLRTPTPHSNQTPQPHQSSYLELGFLGTLPQPVTSTPTPTDGRSSPVAVKLELQHSASVGNTSTTSSIVAPKPQDTTVTYGVLDFDKMKVLNVLQRQREQEREEHKAARKDDDKKKSREKPVTQRRHTHHK